MRVKVFDRHIAEGIPGDCAKCAGALAIHEADPTVSQALVAPDTVIVYRGGVPTTYRTPDVLRKFMYQFDKVGCAAPFRKLYLREFEFDLEPVPVGVRRLAA